MEKPIDDLDRLLRTDPLWQKVVSSMNFNLLRKYYFEYSILTHNVIHTQDYDNTVMKNNVWSKMMDINKEIFHMYDKSGFTEILTLFTPIIFDFSFSRTSEFKNHEEQYLKSIDIPKKIWSKFWTTVDESKYELFSEMEKNPNYFSLSKFYSSKDIMHNGPGNLGPMSPYNIGKLVFAGIAGTLGIVNAYMIPITAGVSLASNIASLAVQLIGIANERK